MIVLGIDPGSVVCGYGAIDYDGRAFRLVEYGVVQARKMEPDFNLRLKEIYERLEKVIERVRPEAAAFESGFYSKNVQSLIKLTHARAAAILAAVMHDVPVHEYSPKEVKKAVTGKGAATKEQVQFMVKKMMEIEETPEFFDATDALAVAVCHSIRPAFASGKGGSWADFIKHNPGRIAGGTF